MTTAVIWSKYHCPHCERARFLLQRSGIPFEEKKIGDGFTKEDLLESVPNARTVPQIFIDGKHIGGYLELEKYLKENN